MAVTYDYYRIFYYVAKHRSFTSAAKFLMNSQPNITRTINNLEEELGCKLFLRSHRGVQLTPEGERLFEHVRIAHEQLQIGEAELSGSRRLQSGRISVSVSEIALHGLLLPVLRRFHLSFPDVHIRISNHSTRQAIAAVQSGTVELAIVTTPTGVVKPLEERCLTAFQDILIAGPQYASLSHKTLRMKDLAEYPLICLGRETKTYAFFNQLFAQHQLTLQPDIELTTADQILPVVKCGLGMGFLPAFLAEEAIARGEVVALQLKEVIPKRHICMVKNQEVPLSIAGQELEKMLMEASKRA